MRKTWADVKVGYTLVCRFSGHLETMFILRIERGALAEGKHGILVTALNYLDDNSPDYREIGVEDHNVLSDAGWTEVWPWPRE